METNETKETVREFSLVQVARLFKLHKVRVWQALQASGMKYGYKETGKRGRPPVSLKEGHIAAIAKQLDRDNPLTKKARKAKAVSAPVVENPAEPATPAE